MITKPLLLAALSLGTFVSSAAVAAENRIPVFAHYMTCFAATPEFYQREVELARRYGIDGFALNCGEWKELRPDGKIKETSYVRSADSLYEAAKISGPDFKLFFSPDWTGPFIRTQSDLNIGDMVRRYYDHPNQFRHEGNAFFSGYGGRVANYDAPITKLRNEGLKITLVPFPSQAQHPMTWSFEKVLDLLPENGPFDGIFRFTCDGTVQEIIDVNATARRATLHRKKLYMAGVVPAYNSPNLRDFGGMRGYTAMWEGLIRDRPDFVEIVTWNDYNEDSNLMPYRWKSGKLASDKRYFNRDESFLDVTAFYSAWLHNRVRPEIVQDKLYFAYRTRSRALTKVWDEKEKKWDDLRFSRYPYDQIHDDVRDQVYVTAFLTAPAEVEIVQGDRTERFPLLAGIAFAETALRPGFTPQVRLIRQKDVLIDVSGRREVVSEPTVENSVQAYHLANRLWMSGAAVDKPAHSFALGDKVLKPGSEPLVIEAKNPGNALHNFRLTYKNAGPREARVTLYADGAPGAEGNFPHYFPLTLPPTGEAFRTISFFWSTWDANTRFTVRSDFSEDPKTQTVDFNDFGEVTLRTLALIPVPIAKSAPAPKLNHPELVTIPGGEFVMGGDQGEPDERPARKVRLSPFALGKYEVTNEEFERFMPEHRSMRDSFSWRDREPVIYVSWTMAVKYCNFLSRENGLTPAYEEKTGALIENADGFRLPTEAEWEYAASGRGENRVYPWGNEPPSPDRGNFQLGASLDPDHRRNSANAAGGVRVVGDYLAGSSRDGVMDLAGNVAEWCTDTYRDYPTDGVTTDPVGTLTSPHRTIRGGSWGYYNHSQRNRDREFNSGGYGGYIYLGFRVALPKAGIEKLKP